jgi:hypothetical protein
MSHNDSEMLPPLPELGFYYHYKHDPNGEINNYAYEVKGVARHTEDKSFLVLYVPLYEADWFAPAKYQARPLSMFMESVTKAEKTSPRFAKITDPTILAELTKIRDQMYPSK